MILAVFSDTHGSTAGMAAAGKTVFASSFAMFAAGRAYEIVRNSIGYPHLNVKIGATHAGISVGEDGATHQCCEDIALMRTIPGMVVISPSDDTEARAAVKAAIDYKGPVYLHFGRLAVPVFNDPATYHFEMGKGVTLREGGDLTIIANGLMVWESLKAAEELEKSGADKGLGQYFAALTNMRSVGVMGDERTYDYAVALRAVITSDFMTAEAAEIPFDVLSRVMNRIFNEVKGVNRVMYDLTSKPPGTIEFE